MKRSQVAWDTSSQQGRPRLTATLIDKDGLEWKVTINVEPIRLHGKIVSAILVCKTAGMLHSANTHSTISAAQEWCYEKVGIE